MSQEIQFESYIHEFQGLSDEKSQHETEFEVCSFTAAVRHFSVAPISLQTNVCVFDWSAHCAGMFYCILVKSKAKCQLTVLTDRWWF